MIEHSCPRCGYETALAQSKWPDRHPILAVLVGLFALVFMGMMFTVYPTAATTLTVVTAITWAVRSWERERRRRVAVATRADYDHARLMAQMAGPVHSTPPPRPTPPPATAPPARPWHAMTHYPTTKMRSPMKERW